MPFEELPPLFAPGQRLGRYDLVHRLAVGGMAEVYLAYAKGPGDFRKVVAIKRLLPQHALDPQLLHMFLDEARLMARLAHPNVPQVIDVDDGGGVEVPFFVMEYVHGTDLRGVLNAAQGPLPFEHALGIASAVAAGLHHAHEQTGSSGASLDIVHRDVSPSNILISFDGAVRITDFGVAKWAEQKSFTHQGQLKGKFAHMSPEQCRGEPLDRRSDVFALGTLLYEMTTGRTPFVAESDYDLLTQIVSRDAPPPERPDGSYPPALAKIVTRSLQRAPGDRQATAQELQLELESFARENRLVVSPVALASYLESLLGARVTEWREALRSGQSLAEHIDRRSPPAAAGRAGGAGEDAPAKKDRTATDAFAMRPGVSPNGGDAAGGADPASRAVAPAARNPMARTLAIGAGAGIALGVLWVATEVTSRWQLGSRIDTAPARSAEVGPHTPTVVPQRPPKPPEQMAAGQAPAVGPATAAAPAIPRASPDALPAFVATVPPARAPRHLRATGGAAAASTALVPAAGPATGLAAPHAEVPPETSPPAAADLEGASRAPAAGKPTAPSPAPVKVWDPDSPVPP